MAQEGIGAWLDRLKCSQIRGALSEKYSVGAVGDLLLLSAHDIETLAVGLKKVPAKKFTLAVENLQRKAAAAGRTRQCQYCGVATGRDGYSAREWGRQVERKCTRCEKAQAFFQSQVPDYEYGFASRPISISVPRLENRGTEFGLGQAEPDLAFILGGASSAVSPARKKAGRAQVVSVEGDRAVFAALHSDLTAAFYGTHRRSSPETEL